MELKWCDRAFQDRAALVHKRMFKKYSKIVVDDVDQENSSSTEHCSKCNNWFSSMDHSAHNCNEDVMNRNHNKRKNVKNKRDGNHNVKGHQRKSLFNKRSGRISCSKRMRCDSSSVDSAPSKKVKRDDKIPRARKKAVSFN